MIAFLNFPIRELTDGGDCRLHYVTTEMRTGDKMPGSAEFYFFDLESFTKSEDELANDAEKWLFLLRNSCSLESVPKSICGEAYDVFLEAAEIAGFSKEQYEKYEKDMVTELDMKLALAYAEEKGEAKGKAEGIQQTAANFKRLGISVEDIVKATGLTAEEVAGL